MIFAWIRFRASVRLPLAMLALVAGLALAGIVVTSALHTGAVVLAGVPPANVHVLLTVRTVKSVLTKALIAIHEIPALASVQAGRRRTVVDEFLTVFSWP